jgi:hypothetical protein
MQKDWRNLMSLCHGTAIQQAASHTLEVLRVFPLPGPFDPMLASAIPLDIAIAGSDLDMVCAVERRHHGGIR